MIGTTLQSRYRLDSELGRGGMGVVYRAHDTVLDRAVAVKVLSESGLGTEGRARLLREAQSAAKLNHPNIVSVYDAGEASIDPSGLEDPKGVGSDMNFAMTFCRRCATIAFASVLIVASRRATTQPGAVP